jgi:uncharacterized membrane protein
MILINNTVPMVQMMRYCIFTIAVVLLLGIMVTGSAAPDPSYTVTYAINIQEDGSALWQVEYRTLLGTDEDLNAFNNYSSELPSVYLPQFRDLMQHSAAQAAVATARHMEVDGFRGDAVVQTSPTGRYGVIIYSFLWKGFARTGGDLAIGDTFAGGLYLAKDNTLIIRYPAGYTVKTAEPAPDLVRDGLTWYGLRSFGAGEPRVIIEKPAFPLLFVATGLVIAIVTLAGFIIYFIQKRRMERDAAEEPAVPLSESEMISLEERIIQLVTSHGGELFQSEIVKNMGLPKSTVSSALNGLHRRGVIQKVKKGRENLIRLV